MYQAARFGRGQQQGAARPEHPPDLRDRPVGVDQVLDQLAHDHHVRGAVRDRQARPGHAAAQHGEAEGPRLPQGMVGPVDADEPVRRVLLRRDREGGAVAAPHVDDHRRAGRVPVPQDPGQHPGLALGAVQARAERDAGALVELLQRAAPAGEVTGMAGSSRA